MIVCPKCGYIRKQEDTAPEYQCPHCQIVYAKYVAYQEKRLAQQKALQIQQTEFVPISFWGKYLFFIGLAVIVELLLSIVDFLNIFWSKTGACMACYFFSAAIAYFIIYYNQLWLRLFNSNKFNRLLFAGLAIYFISEGASSVNKFFDYSLVQPIALLCSTVGLITILSGIVGLLLGLATQKIEEKKSIKMIYIGITLLIYYVVSALPIQSFFLIQCDYADAMIVVVNFLISALIAFVFIKKTKLAQCIVCMPSALELLKMGIAFQVVVLVIQALLIFIAFIIVKIENNVVFLLFISLAYFSPPFILFSLLLPYIIKISIFVASYGAKVLIFFGVLNVIFDTFLPKPRVINKTS